MALNVPAGNVGNLSFGPGIVYITTTKGAPITGGFATPNVDIGYVRNSQLSVTRTKLDVFQGSPKGYITTFALQDDVNLQVTGLEWNLNNLAILLGAGSVSGTSFKFGGAGTFNEVSVNMIHRTPNNGTVDIRIFRAQGTGEMSVPFSDDLQEFSYTFRGLEMLTNWSGNPLAVGQRLFEIVYTPGA